MSTAATATSTTSTTTTSAAAMVRRTGIFTGLFAGLGIKVSPGVSRHTAVHTSSEATPATTGIVMFLLLLGVPLPSVQGTQFAQSVTLPLIVHGPAMLAFLASLLFSNLLALKERGLVCLSPSMCSGNFGSVFFGSSNTTGEFFFRKFRLVAS